MLSDTCLDYFWGHMRSRVKPHGRLMLWLLFEPPAKYPKFNLVGW